MSGLSRDVLKWLQGLDLSYSVKNIKRDFSNGFLIAEIFSRYFPHDLQMHSFDNGTGLAKKIANWELLERFFRKRNVPLNRTMIDAVVHCKEGAAVPMLETIYTCLTNKKVVSVKPKNDDELIPPFARPTASQMLKDNIRDSELTTTLSDEYETSQRARNLLDSHKEVLKQEKNADPGRFAVGTKEEKKPTRLQNRPIPSSVNNQQQHINFKEVQVRTIDRNIALVRANKHGNFDGSPMVQNSPGSFRGLEDNNNNNNNANLSGMSPRGNLNGNGGHAAGGGAAAALMMNNSMNGNENDGTNSNHHHNNNKQNLTHIVHEIIDSQIGGKAEMRMLDGKSQLVVGLVDNVLMERFKPRIVIDLLEKMTDEAAVLAETCLVYPRDFHRLVSWFSPFLSRMEFVDIADLVLVMLTQVGQELRAMDPFVAATLFCDYGLVKLAKPLTILDMRRPALLGLFYQYVEPDRRLGAIRCLRDELNNMNVFIACLAVLLSYEDQLDHSLLDMYIYYAVVGLGAEAPSLRASAISMLSDIVLHEPSTIVPLLPRLEELVADTWWEVSSQMIILCCRLLERLSSANNSNNNNENNHDPHAVDTICELLLAVVLRNRSPVAYKVGVMHMGTIAYEYPKVREALKICVLNLTERDIGDIVVGHGLGVDRGVRAGGGVGMSSSIKDGANSGLSENNNVNKQPNHSNSHSKRSKSGIISSNPAVFEPLKVPLHAAEALSKKVTEAELENIEIEHIAILYMCTEETIESDDLGDWKDILTALKDHLYVALCDETLCHYAARCSYRLIMALAESSFDTLSALASSLIFVFQGESEMCKNAALKLLQEIGAAGDPFETAMQDLAVKCRSLWSTELQPWLKANGIDGAEAPNMQNSL